MVKLVEYPSSEDEDASDSSHWSSYDQIPSSPSDSFSYPMRESDDDEEDEDYAPSETSLDGGSVTSSVDTDDLDPDDMDTEQTLEHKGVFYEWKDLQKAFEKNPFKRRNMEHEAEDKQEDAESNLSGKFTFQAAFNAAEKDPKTTGVTPKFSQLFTENGAKETAFNAPRVDIPDFSKQTTASRTSDYTFGKTGSDDTQMQNPRQVEGGFTIGQSGKAPKPYNFAGHGRKERVLKVPSVKIDADTPMRSPSPQAKAARTPTNGEFLFGQAYKNRKPFVFARQNSNESMHSTESAPTSATRLPWETKGPVRINSVDRMDVNKEPTSAFFTTGVFEPKTPQRAFGRRNKKINTTAVPPQRHNSSPSLFGAPASNCAFGSSAFGTSQTIRQQTNASSTVTIDLTGDTEHENDERSSEAASRKLFNNPPTGYTGESFVFGNSNAKQFQESSAPPFQTNTFGSSTPNTSASEQFMFGNGTARHPYELRKVDTNARTGAANSNFPGRQADNVATVNTGGFQIGSSDVKKNSRVRPRKSGMFANKNTPRKDAKVGVNEPEPSPGFSSTTPSPFGMHSRKNARIRRNGRSPPADPFVTPTFQAHPTSLSKGEIHRNVVPTANKDMSSAFGDAPAGVTAFGSGTTQPHDKTREDSVFSFSNLQHTNYSTVFGPTGPTQPSKSQPNESTPRRAFAGSRRILRAALRNVGAGGDRAKSAPPATGYHHTEGDSEMDSEDDRDWEELKRLGGVAHGSRKYDEAAEHYRQSIEVFESLLYHGLISDTSERRADKAKLHANRAASLMMLMRITEAQQECRRSIEVDATYARAYLRLGRIQVQLGDTAHAQANFDTARHLMEGQNGEIRNGDQTDHASLVKMEATVKKLIMLRGEIKWYLDHGDFKQALIRTERALALASSSRKLQVQKGRILLHQREFDELVKFCSSIIEKQQTLLKKLSSPANRDGAKSKSCKLKTVDKIAFIGIDLGLLWATTLHYQNKVEDAFQILNALEVVAPCSSHVIQLKQQWHEMKQLKHDGNERFKRGDYEAAVRVYTEALQIDPQHQEFCAIIYCNRAAAQMGLGLHHTAILDCNDALQRKTNYPRALLRRARCHFAMKMHHEAVKDFDKYLRGQPGDVPIDATADIRRERNEAKAAIAKAREEVRQREAAKKRAEREQSQRRQHRWEDTSWNNSNFYENFRRTSSNRSNGSSYGSRHQSSGAGGRASFMAPKTLHRTHYDVLGIEKASTVDQIKKAYRKLALVYHPDKAKTSTHAELFKEMTAAYNILSDDSARAKYDRELIYNRFGNFYES